MEWGGGIIDEAPVFQPLGCAMALRHVITWHGWLVGVEADVCPLDSIVVKGNDSDPLFQSDTGGC